MRLVVIDTQKGSYRVFEDRDLVAEYHAVPGAEVSASDVEAIRTAETQKEPA